MILILTNSKDYSTNRVIDWISYFKQTYFRVNFEDAIISFSINLSKTELIEIEFDTGKKIDFSKINSFWYRRGNFILNLFTHKNTEYSNELIDHLNMEWETIFTYLHRKLEKSHHLGSFETEHINKIEALSIAASIDIEIPQTLISNRKGNMKKFFSKVNDKCITKSISEIFSQIDDIENKILYSIISEVREEDFLISDNIFPTLLQERIGRQFDLRIFYLDKKCYSMAIFNTTTDDVVDIRDCLNYAKCRTVPYKIPSELNEKICILMNKLNLNTGSLDFVVTEDNRYIFLEVNPIGQYSFLSEDCNYYIDKKIAEYLKNN